MIVKIIGLIIGLLVLGGVIAAVCAVLLFV